MSDVAVLVPSYDGYADIWPIAAKLFSRFWPDRTMPMYWMTNGARVPYIARPIVQPQVTPERWGLNIADAVDSIPEPLILYWFEEQFLLSAVPNDLVMEGAELLNTHPDIANVNITRYYANAFGIQYAPTSGRFMEFPKELFGRTAFIPTIIRKDIFTTMLRALTSGRDFEMEASAFVTRHYPAMRSMVPCVSTFRFCDNALLKGPWRQCAVKHLKELGIEVDFARRGISDDVCTWMDGAVA